MTETAPPTPAASPTPLVPQFGRGFPWALVTTPDTLVLDLSGMPRGGAGFAGIVPDLPAGSPVLLLDGRPGSRARLRAAARARGLQIEHEYVVLPGLRSAAMIAEDSRAAVCWLRDTVLTVPAGVSGLAPAADLTLAVLQHLLPWQAVGAVTPGRALAARCLTGPVPDARPVPDAGPSARPLAAAPSTIAVLATSRDVNAKVSVLVLPPGADRPGTVVKIPLTLPAERAVEAEGRMLAALHATGAAVIDQVVPRLLRTHRVGGLTAIEMTALPGTPMQTTYHRWFHSARRVAVQLDLELAGQWLAVLQRQTAGPPIPVRLLADGLAGLERRWPGDARVAALRERLGPDADRLAAVQAPGCVVHGDFWHGNVLVRGGAVSAVIDWECGSLAADPTRDVARFPLSYALYLDRHTRPGRRVRGHRGLVAGEWGAGVEYALGGEGWFAASVQEFVRAALRRLGVPEQAWRSVLLGGVADVAARTDHPEFAGQHLDLLYRLVERFGTGGW